MNSAKAALCLLLALSLSSLLSGCLSGTDGQERSESWVAREDIPEIPDKLDIDDATGIPTISVYDKSDDSLQELDIETYVAGVVAGEMKNDWPMEALKAQAILARTFVLKFCQDKDSQYKGADISTDVSEAQAYDAEAVNDRVMNAVEATRGQVMAYDGDFPNAWFHAHSGGVTELPGIALDYKEADPDYLKPVRSKESDKAPEDVRAWTADFNKGEVKKACADAGLKVDAIESIEAGEKGESGRLKTLLINGQAVSAPSFRIQIGANKLKSTLIDKIEVDSDGVTFSGRGFGHGVGMSQWGAYEMAERGSDAREIVRHYFSDVDIVSLW